MKVSDYKALFTSEAGEILQALEAGVMALESGEDASSCIEELFRNAHNLKGMSGAMGYERVVEASHALENVLDRCRKGEIGVGRAEADLLLRAVDMLRELVDATVAEEGVDCGDLLGEMLVLISPMATRNVAACSRPGPAVDEEEEEPSDDGGQGPGPSAGGNLHEQVTSTRVALERLDHLMDLVGELIISRIRLSSIARDIGDKHLDKELSTSGRLISEIQKEVMEARLIPAGQIFQRFRRLVRDVSLELGKDVEFEICGADIGLDRTVLESMVDPLVHLLRNALDHGVETPGERAAAGKPERATVALRASRERNFVVLEVSDDGKGIDIEKIGKGGDGAETGAAGKELTKEDLCRVLTTPGFSTREEVSRYSGRGVGMDVVQRAADMLGGRMEIETERGSGTRIAIRLPINLSIIKALLFEVGDEVHALPAEYVAETTRVERGSFRTVMGQNVFPASDGPIPVVSPEELFGIEERGEGARFSKMIIVNTGEGRVGLVAGRILGQQDVVIKSLPSMIRGVSGISGATVLGSGRIAFIWDPRFLFKGRCVDEPDKEAVVS